MVTGRVLRRHAGGYLVYADELDATLQCPLRARLKKEGVSVFTGDEVELDEVEIPAAGERGSGVIAARLPRQNFLSRPYLANVDQVIIVQAIHSPEWNSLLVDRYLVHLHLELDSARRFICVNKSDLGTEDELSALRKIYEPLDYTVLLVSAKSGEGMDELRQVLTGRTSVLTGPSGVGKSSIINQLNPELALKVDVNEELLVGRHTTTYSELYPMRDSNGHPTGWIADTPGFSLGELKHPEPAEVAWQFPELAKFAEDCKFSNCLHIVEQDCNVLKNLEKVAPSRYESYLVLVEESKAESRLRAETSQKVETGTVKYVGGGRGRGRAIPKLSNKYRAASKRKERQQVQDWHQDEEAEDVDDATADADSDERDPRLATDD